MFLVDPECFQADRLENSEMGRRHRKVRDRSALGMVDFEVGTREASRHLDECLSGEQTSYAHTGREFMDTIMRMGYIQSFTGQSCPILLHAARFLLSDAPYCGRVLTDRGAIPTLFPAPQSTERASVQDTCNLGFLTPS